MDELWVCWATGCTNTHKKDRWNNSKAEKEGWFFQKYNIAWCPEHVPSWVEGWRKSKEK